MTRLEQQTFVNDLMQSFQSSFDADFMAGRIPEHWGGRQLRMLISNRVSREAVWDFRFVREFENDCLINNL